MLAVRLGKQLEAAIARIAEATGSTRSSVMRYLEDREDSTAMRNDTQSGVPADGSHSTFV